MYNICPTQLNVTFLIITTFSIMFGKSVPHVTAKASEYMMIKMNHTEMDDIQGRGRLYCEGYKVI